MEPVTEKHQKYINQIMEQALLLIEGGKATLENAFEMALKQDMDRIEAVISQMCHDRDSGCTIGFIKDSNMDKFCSVMGKKVYTKIREEL